MSHPRKDTTMEEEAGNEDIFDFNPVDRSHPSISQKRVIRIREKPFRSSPSTSSSAGSSFLFSSLSQSTTASIASSRKVPVKSSNPVEVDAWSVDDPSSSGSRFTIRSVPSSTKNAHIETEEDSKPAESHSVARNTVSSPEKKTTRKQLRSSTSPASLVSPRPSNRSVRFSPPDRPEVDLRKRNSSSVTGNELQCGSPNGMPRLKRPRTPPSKIPAATKMTKPKRGRPPLPPSKVSNHPKEKSFVSRNGVAKAPKSRMRRHTTIATADVYSMQDAGNYQMLVDECLYLCSSITSSLTSYSGTAADGVPKLRRAVSNAVDLGHLLSSKSNRKTLFLRSSNEASHWDGDPLPAILSVFGWMVQLASELALPHDSTEEDDSLCDTPNRHGGNRSTLSVASPCMMNANHCNVALRETKRQLLDALSVCLYFVSLDCTLSDESCFVPSSNSGSMAMAVAAKSARRIRHAILTHDTCIRGILHLILEDPLTYYMRGRQDFRLGRTPEYVDCEVGDLNDVKVSLSGEMSPASPFRGHVKTSGVSGMSNSPMSNGSSVGKFRESPESERASSSASFGSLDPTVAGRLKRKKRRLELLENAADSKWTTDDDRLSFPSDVSTSQNSLERPCGDIDDVLSVVSSTGSVRNRTQNRLDQLTLQVRERILLFRSDGSDKNLHQLIESHSCKSSMNELTCMIIPLVALAIIVSGKLASNDESCIDDDDGQEYGEANSSDYNPLLETNRLLGTNGAIPLLSQALSEALAAVTHQVELGCTPLLRRDFDGRNCVGCLSMLQYRVQKLVSLIDGASLLSPSNREKFCMEGFTQEASGFLVVGLLNVLRKQLWKNGSDAVVDPTLFDRIWGEVTLSVLKMLTSLSHENKIAAHELEAELDPNGSGCEMKPTADTERCGLQVIAEVLHHAVSISAQWERCNEHDGTDAKLVYDAVIFCLNIFANVMESGCSRHVFVKMKISTTGLGSEKQSDGFLSWLTRWLVGETQSFRDAVIESTFGSSPCKHQERELHENEDEKLVLVGNGFVFLCCLLVDAADGASDENDAMSCILNELPGDTHAAKLAFVKNTLKAFCNFYHYSVGDLSIAIVAPVKSLMQRLDSTLSTPEIADT